MFFRTLQCGFIRCDGFLLEDELLLKKGQLYSQSLSAVVDVLKTSRRQFEPTLGSMHLFINADDGLLALNDTFTGFVPIGL